MSEKPNNAIAVIGIDIGKNSFHVVGLDARGAIVLRQKWSRSQVEARFANMPPCLIGMEACVGAHHLSRKLQGLGHDARLMPTKYVRSYSKGQRNDFRDAEAIAEAVQRPTMKSVATKTADQLDLQALHRVRERLVSQRTGIINQIRAFLLDRGSAAGTTLPVRRTAKDSGHALAYPGATHSAPDRGPLPVLSPIDPSLQPRHRYQPPAALHHAEPLGAAPFPDRVLRIAEPFARRIRIERVVGR